MDLQGPEIILTLAILVLSTSFYIYLRGNRWHAAVGAGVANLVWLLIVLRCSHMDLFKQPDVRFAYLIQTVCSLTLVLLCIPHKKQRPENPAVWLDYLPGASGSICIVFLWWFSHPVLPVYEAHWLLWFCLGFHFMRRPQPETGMALVLLSFLGHVFFSINFASYVLPDLQFTGLLFPLALFALSLSMLIFAAMKMSGLVRIPLLLFCPAFLMLAIMGWSLLQISLPPVT